MNASPHSSSKLSEAELVQQMKICNYEKYKTLVRMHLSFELELNTDEFDLPSHEIIYEDKGKLKKWNRLSKKHKIAANTGCATTSKSAGNSPTEGVGQQIDAGFIFHLAEIKKFLMLEKNLKQEGIFRKTGSASRQNELRLRFQNEEPLILDSYTAHDCATVFKSFLNELTEPLLTDAHYPAHLQIAPLVMSFNASSSSVRPERIKREQRLLNSMQYLLLLLPDDNRRLLIHIIDILNAVVRFESINKMSADNLATLFAPHLICPRNMPPEALHYLSKKLSSIIAYMIIKGTEIFEVPAKLLTDIRAYFLCKRKKTISPEKTLDDSISDISTVNTVYTFVDRERTAAAHTANTTDTELAQLYAHIQSLPESSKKRRLIKQFNKQNGQGTPLQLVIMNRLKNNEATRSAKSISDSIKKHIFHKGIMSRTPKRSNTNVKTPTNIGVETPNFSNTKPPKLRVLFQSPASSNMPANNIVTNTSLKPHPLQKSISSTSLLLNSSTRNAQNYQHVNSKQVNDETETSSSSCASSTNSSNDAPQQLQLDPQNSSCDSLATLEQQQFQTTHSAEPAKILNCNTATSNNRVGDKKAVAWDDHNLVNAYEENTCGNLQSADEFKSRYKSEPNLSSIVNKQLLEIPKTLFENRSSPLQKVPSDAAGASKSLTRRLIKGVSMGNLKFPLVRSVSTLSKRRHSDEAPTSTTNDAASTSYMPRHVAFHSELEDLDDHTFEEDSNDHIGTDSELNSENETGNTALCTEITNESSSCELSDHSALNANEAYDQILVQPSGLYRNINLLTSTPSLLLGRRSMSPITKSAQRMPRSMQESIMTPRSRKPVMVFTTTLGSSDQNRTIYRSELSSFREQDDNESPVKPISYNETEDAVDSCTNLKKKQQAAQLKSRFRALHGGILVNHCSKSNEALTDDFKKYLHSRSVFTESPPVDSSFSSHSDDFKDDDFDEHNSTAEIVNLNDSQLSPSLLYCLDGNEPSADTDDSSIVVEKVHNQSNKNSSCSDEAYETPPAHATKSSRLRHCDSLHSRFDNTLKRGASSAECNKENKQNDVEDDYLLTRKIFISETSF